MTWNSVNINIQNIKVETGRAALIQMPHSSDFDGYCFWVSKKLLRQGRHSYAVKMIFKDDFTFKLKKANKKGNFLEETEITATELKEVFGIMDENIRSSKKDSESYLIVEEPRKIEKDVVVPECLKNKRKPSINSED